MAIKSTYWYDKQRRDDAKVAKYIRAAIKSLSTAIDSPLIDRNDAHTLDLIRTALVNVMKEYEHAN
jgi:hypothetical protein